MSDGILPAIGATGCVKRQVLNPYTRLFEWPSDLPVSDPALKLAMEADLPVQSVFLCRREVQGRMYA